MQELNDWQHFQLTFDPNPSGSFKHGYDASGETVMEAMAGCIISMSKALMNNDGKE